MASFEAMTSKRIISVSAAAVMGIALTGCVALQPIVVHETVGPPTFHRSPEPTLGWLLVYSAIQHEHECSDFDLRSQFAIRADSGDLIHRVTNGGPACSTAPVALPSVRYRISLRESNSA